MNGVRSRFSIPALAAASIAVVLCATAVAAPAQRSSGTTVPAARCRRTTSTAIGKVGLGSPDVTETKSKDSAVRGAAGAPRSDAAQGGGNLLSEQRAADSVAKSLGVTKSAARVALNALIPLSEHPDGMNPADTAFAAVASGLGVTSAQLEQALVTLKVGSRPAGATNPGKPAIAPGTAKTGSSVADRAHDLLSEQRAADSVAKSLGVTKAAARGGTECFARPVCTPEWPESDGRRLRRGGLPAGRHPRPASAGPRHAQDQRVSQPDPIPTRKRP